MLNYFFSYFTDYIPRKSSLVFTLFCLFFSVDALADLTVLMYHNIGVNPAATSVTKETFTKQMDYLHANNYIVLSEDELKEFYSNGKNFNDDKYVLITFDDGWATQMIAASIMKEYGYGAIFFINGSQIKQKSKLYLDYEQLKMIKENNLNSISNHSFTHSSKLYKNIGLVEDTELSDAFFSKNFNYVPNSYALPYGLYSKDYVDYLRANGYKFIYGTNNGKILISKNLAYKIIPRYDINNLITMKRFKEILN